MKILFPKISILSLLILLISVGSAHAKKIQRKNLVVYAKQLTVENGLSSNVCYALLRDSRGFTWIGTRNGLNKYDGNTFRHYFHTPFDSTGLKSNVIKALAEDRSGAIWIGTTGAGLARLDCVTDKIIHFRHNPSDPGSIGTDNVQRLFVDSKGRLWIGLENGELDYFEPQTQKFWRYTNIIDTQFRSVKVHNNIESITEVENGVLFIHKLFGNVFFDPSTARCNSLVVLEIAEHKSLFAPDLFHESKHDIWLAEDHHFFLYSLMPSKDNNFIKYVKKLISVDPLQTSWEKLIYRNDSVVWRIRNYRLCEINILSGSIREIDIRSSNDNIIKLGTPTDVIEDNQGDIWIATSDGVVIIQPGLRPISLCNFPNDLNARNRSARTLCFDGNNQLWIGTSNGSLYYVDSGSNAMKQFRMNSKHIPFAWNSISYDGDNKIWLAGSGVPLISINQREHTVVSWFSWDNKYLGHSILADGKSAWLGLVEHGGNLGGGVLYHVTVSPFEIRQYNYLANDSNLLGPRIIMTIVPRDEHSLWLGSSHGLFLFNKETEEFFQYAHNPKDPNSISGNDVWVVLKDRLGQLWVGTWGGGLNLFNEKTGTFGHYTINEGLPSNVIESILEDNSGDLWIATANGISHYDQNKKTFENFGLADGLADVDYEPNAAVKSSDGKLFFGGSHGVVSFYPDAMKREHIAAPLAITALRIGGKLRFGEVLNAGAVSLDHDENDPSIEFSKLDYLDPSGKQYEYMLEGIDKNWIYSGSRNIAYYTNVDPGNYTFRFRTKDDSAHTYSATIIITPPFWQRRWFEAGVVLLSLFIVGFLLQRRITKRKEFQDQLELATENERIELAGELHDGPLQDLFGARFLLDPLIGKEKPDLNAGKLDVLLKKVRDDLRTLTGELQIPRFESGFAEELDVFCARFEERHPAIKVVKNIYREIAPLPRKTEQNLFRIFRTAIANIAKHANASQIEVAFVTTQDYVTLTIRDNGDGFTVPQDFGTLVKSKHYGLFLMHSYASAINAKCSVLSKPRKGTTVEVVVPVTKPLWRLSKAGG